MSLPSNFNSAYSIGLVLHPVYPQYMAIRILKRAIPMKLAIPKLPSISPSLRTINSLSTQRPPIKSALKHISIGHRQFSFALDAILLGVGVVGDFAFVDAPGGVPYFDCNGVEAGGVEELDVVVFVGTDETYIYWLVLLPLAVESEVVMFIGHFSLSLQLVTFEPSQVVDILLYKIDPTLAIHTILTLSSLDMSLIERNASLIQKPFMLIDIVRLQTVQCPLLHLLLFDLFNEQLFFSSLQPYQFT